MDSSSAKYPSGGSTDNQCVVTDNNRICSHPNLQRIVTTSEFLIGVEHREKTSWFLIVLNRHNGEKVREIPLDQGETVPLLKVFERGSIDLFRKLYEGIWGRDEEGLLVVTPSGCVSSLTLSDWRLDRICDDRIRRPILIDKLSLFGRCDSLVIVSKNGQILTISQDERGRLDSKQSAGTCDVIAAAVRDCRLLISTLYDVRIIHIKPDNSRKLCMETTHLLYENIVAISWLNDNCVVGIHKNGRSVKIPVNSMMEQRCEWQLEKLKFLSAKVAGLSQKHVILDSLLPQLGVVAALNVDDSGQCEKCYKNRALLQLDINVQTLQQGSKSMLHLMITVRNRSKVLFKNWRLNVSMVPKSDAVMSTSATFLIRELKPNDQIVFPVPVTKDFWRYIPLRVYSTLNYKLELDGELMDVMGNLPVEILDVVNVSGAEAEDWRIESLMEKRKEEDKQEEERKEEEILMGVEKFCPICYPDRQNIAVDLLSDLARHTTNHTRPNNHTLLLTPPNDDVITVTSSRDVDHVRVNVSADVGGRVKDVMNAVRERYKRMLVTS